MKPLPKKTPGADLFAAVGSVDVSQGAQEESVCAGRAEQPRRYTGLQLRQVTLHKALVAKPLAVANWNCSRLRKDTC